MSKFFVLRNCFTGDLSGGDMHAGGLCLWLLDNKKDVNLIHAAKDGQQEAYFGTDRIPQVTYADGIKNPVPLMFFSRAFKSSKVKLKFDKNTNYFVASSHFLPDVWPIVSLSRRAPNAKKIAYIHHIVQDMPRPKSLNTFLANMQEKLCFYLIKKFFDQVITVNKDVVTGLKRRGFKQPILVSTNFIDNLNTKTVKFTDKKYDVVFCGRMVKQKGIYDFVEVCRILSRKDKNFRAIAMGVGPELDNLRNVVEQQKLPINFTGKVSEKQKFEIFSQSKLFVFPSVEEGWGIVLAESMSVGTPVLGYNLPVYKPIFGDNVFTVKLKNQKQLIEKSAELLADFRKNSIDYAKKQSQIINAVQEFTQDKVISHEYEFIAGSKQ